MMKILLIASAICFIASLAFFSYVVRHPKHVDVSATPPISEEVREREKQATKACKDAHGIPYREQNIYKECAIKKDLKSK